MFVKLNIPVDKLMIERPKYVKDEHLAFLNRCFGANNPACAMPYTWQVAEEFSIPVEVARRIVNYWFKTLNDDEE